MSRLECKVFKHYCCMVEFIIRICPDWNVKLSAEVVINHIEFIRICPDWNVKAFAYPLLFLSLFIRICPDWNVKMLLYHQGSPNPQLEYVQIGM